MLSNTHISLRRIPQKHPLIRWHFIHICLTLFFQKNPSKTSSHETVLYQYYFSYKYIYIYNTVYLFYIRHDSLRRLPQEHPLITQFVINILHILYRIHSEQSLKNILSCDSSSSIFVYMISIKFGSKFPQ